MKKAGVISVGNELLAGYTANTNAAYLGRRLLELGIPTVSGYTVADDADLIVDALKKAALQADIIIVTGGLGPTDDDVTRQAFAKFLGTELKLQKKLLKKIQDFFASRERQMPENTKVQAYIPAGAKAIENNLGTAPGIMAKLDSRPAPGIQYQASRLLIALPGVPGEMKQMFEECVAGELEKFARSDREQVISVRKLRCFGAGESFIAEKLGGLMRRGRNPLINCTASCGVITLYVTATAGDKKSAEEMAEADSRELHRLLGELVYGRDEQTLAEVAGAKLRAGGKKLAVAESCTGGLIAKMLTDVPGSSDYFTHGWVTYSNEAKICALGVERGLIEKHGAVSEEVAGSMAREAREKAGADVAIGVTGIAGPGGGTDQKPVGLVYIALSVPAEQDVRRYVFPSSREHIRHRTALAALNLLRLRL